MKTFCEAHAPGLFDLLEKVISSDYSSTLDHDGRAKLRRQRVVSELYRLAYLNNQVNY